jgi:hypothetical protein
MPCVYGWLQIKMKLKKIIYTLLIMTGAFICTDHNSFAQCKAKQIMKACKPNIQKPYKYDSYAISDFVSAKTAKTIEVEFTAFKGCAYKIIFCSSGFQSEVKMNIYDKNMHIKQNRHKVYDNDQGIDNNFWSFVPPKSGNYFIDYEIPAMTGDKAESGCIVMLISYYEDPKAE